MTYGGNNFNVFPEIVPAREITTKIEKTFLFSSVAVNLFLEWAYNAASSIAPTLIRHRRSLSDCIDALSHLICMQCKFSLFLYFCFISFIVISKDESSASEMTYIVSSGALNSTPTNVHVAFVSC